MGVQVGGWVRGRVAELRNYGPALGGWWCVGSRAAEARGVPALRRCRHVLAGLQQCAVMPYTRPN
mgnify:CR=1 FL=1